MSIRVLLVDDSSLVRKVMKKTLAMTGLPVDAVFEAGNGVEGLAVLKQEWVDIIFLDINMPVMNGVTFMEHVQKDPSYSKTPVIVISTEGSDDRKEQLKQLGIKAYLRKPSTPEAISETVTNLLGELHGN